MGTRQPEIRNLALGPNEPLEERIRALVEPRFAVAFDEAAESALRIVGPASWSAPVPRRSSTTACG